MNLKRIAAAGLALSLTASAAPGTVAEETGAEIVIADSSGAGSIYIDPAASEYDGISLAAEAAADDIEAVTGSRPEIVYSLPESGTVIIAGVVDEEIIADEELEWEISASNENIKSADWERYQIQVKYDGDLTKVIVAGADKRGTAYGLFHITQDLCGVSPWVWWADVTPAHKDILSFTAEELTVTSIRPSVNYRGIFLNNEAPSLSAYVKDRFGDYNYLFYANVCELLLRLKANYLWPAMWGNAFADDGVLNIENAKDTSNLYKLPESERDTLANERIAEDYGIVISFSHHEPMLRSGVEWQRIQSGAPQYTKPTLEGVPVNEWNYFLNSDNIYDFWNDGIERSGGFDNNLITIGMRGEGDSALTNPDGTKFTLQQNVELLKNVITDQKEILQSHSLNSGPQMFALYTEVQQYWYGYDAETGQTSDALKDWEALKDDIIVLCEDNFGYTRFLTYPDERDDRNWGMYYHFDMNGGAHSYKWINTVPLQRVWDSMTTSYDYGVDDLWVVNVGDLKPLELPISYFIDMAYDFNTWGTDNPNSTEKYTDSWIRQQFGAVLDDEGIKEVSQIVTDYVDMNGRCKPEIIFSSTFSTVRYNEAQKELRKALSLEERAEEYKAVFEGTPLESAYFELVYHPAVATATVNKMLIYSGMNEMYFKQGSMLANLYGSLVDQMVEKDKSLFDMYNALEDGKWNLMMNQKAHTCYTSWDDASGYYPEGRFIEPSEKDSLIVSIPENEDALGNGDTASLPVFESTEMQQYAVTLSTTASAKEYTVYADKDWIKFSGDTQGSFLTGTTFGVYVDFAALKASDSGKITITSLSGDTVTLDVKAVVIDTSSLPDKTYIMSNGNIVIDAENFTQKGSASDLQGRNAGWEELKEYGKWGSTMKMFPTTAVFVTDAEVGEDSSVIDEKNAPWLEYSVYIPEEGSYNVIGCFGHSNNLLPDSRLRYGIELDGGDVTVNQSITDGFGVAGISGEWNRGTKYSGRLAKTEHYLSEGIHTLRFYGYEPNVELQRIVLTKDDMLRTDNGWQGFKDSFFGPDPTYFKGKTIVQQPLISDPAADTAVIPGNLKADQTRFVSSLASKYNISIKGSMSDDAVVEIIIDEGEPITAVKNPATGNFEAETEYEIVPGMHSMEIRLISGSGTAEIAEFTSTRVRTELINDDFENEADAEGYTTYRDGDGIISVSGGVLSVRGYSSGWDENNGIKLDITDIAMNTSGSALYASADVRVTYSGTARLFLERITADGNTERYEFAASGDYKDNSLSLSGSIDAVAFNADDKVYLCITQYSGQAYFDNIKLWYYPEAITVFSHGFNQNKAAEAALYTAYSDGVGSVAGGIGTVLKYDSGSDESGIMGIRIDLTEHFGIAEEFSGSVFGASAFIKPGYSWESGNSADLFFEIVSEKGVVRVPLCSAAINNYPYTDELFDSETGGTLGDNWLTQPLEGEALLELEAGDHVYLCITSSNSPQWYDDITVYRMPKQTTSGGEDTPETVLFEDTSEADWAAYTLYNEGSTEAAKRSDGDVISIEFSGNQPEDGKTHEWDENNGIKKEITDAVKGSGASRFFASADITTWYWNQAEAELFVEVYDSDGNIDRYSVDSDIGEADGSTLTLSGFFEISIGSGESAYLCIIHPSDMQNYDNISLYASNAQQPPEQTEEPVNTPEPTEIPPEDGVTVSGISYKEGKPCITVANNSGKTAVVNIYIAHRDGERLTGLEYVTAAAKDEQKTEILFEAFPGDIVYIWDENMKPYISPQTVE